MSDEGINFDMNLQRVAQSPIGTRHSHSRLIEAWTICKFASTARTPCGMTTFLESACESHSSIPFHLRLYACSDQSLVAIFFTKYGLIKHAIGKEWASLGDCHMLLALNYKQC